MKRTARAPAKKLELSPLRRLQSERAGGLGCCCCSPSLTALCCPLRLRSHLLSVKMKTCQEMRSRSFSQRSRRLLMFAQCPDRQICSLSGCIVYTPYCGLNFRLGKYLVGVWPYTEKHVIHEQEALPARNFPPQSSPLTSFSKFIGQQFGNVI